MSDSYRPHGLQNARLPSFPFFRSLIKFMSIELVMLSNHLILCHPLLLLLSTFPSIKVFPNELSHWEILNVKLIPAGFLFFVFVVVVKLINKGLSEDINIKSNTFIVLRFNINKRRFCYIYWKFSSKGNNSMWRNF